MSDSPWSAPDGGGRALEWDEVDPGPSDVFARVAGILNLCFVPLELLFTGFSVLSLGSFVLLVGVTPSPPPPGLEAIYDYLPLYVALYGVFAVGSLVAAIGHLIAGIQLLTRQPNRTWVWISVGTAVGTLVTVYCAPFGIVSAILALVWLTRPEPDPEEG